jgi:hypothetical protein
MIITAEVLAEELRRLKRGRGIAAPDLVESVGPALRDVCAAGHSGPADFRTWLRTAIEQHSGQLVPDMRLAVLAAFGIHPDAQHRFLSDRLRWVLQFIDRDSVRTVDRLANHGIYLIAQRIVASQAHIDLSVRIDVRQQESRIVVACDDAVHEIPISTTAPTLHDAEQAVLDLVTAWLLGTGRRVLAA